MKYQFVVEKASLFVAQTSGRFSTADVSVRLDSADVVLQPGTAFAHTLVATAARDRADLRTVLRLKCVYVSSDA